MGLYDTFETKGIECPFCKHVYDYDCQTKDLGKSLDYFKQGEDVRKPIEFWLAHKVFAELTSEQVKWYKARPKMYSMESYHPEKMGGREAWMIYKNHGARQRFLSNRRFAIFTMFAICPKCDKAYDIYGEIKDYIYVGQKKEAGYIEI